MEESGVGLSRACAVDRLEYAVGLSGQMIGKKS